MPADRRKATAREGIGGARTAGGVGADGGEHFAQPEESAGIHKDHPAGAAGESRTSRFDAHGNEDGAGRDWAVVGEAQSVAAIQPASGARRERDWPLRCPSSCGRGGGRLVA